MELEQAYVQRLEACGIELAAAQQQLSALRATNTLLEQRTALVETGWWPDARPAGACFSSDYRIRGRIQGQTSLSEQDCTVPFSGYPNGIAIKERILPFKPRIEVREYASFEQIISDSRLLQLAAIAASRECGFAVATPARLNISPTAT